MFKPVFHFNRIVAKFNIVPIWLVLPEYSRNNEIMYATFRYDTVKVKKTCMVLLLVYNIYTTVRVKN